MNKLMDYLGCELLGSLDVSFYGCPMPPPNPAASEPPPDVVFNLDQPTAKVRLSPLQLA